MNHDNTAKSATWKSGEFWKSIGKNAAKVAGAIALGAVGAYAYNRFGIRTSTTA